MSKKDMKSCSSFKDYLKENESSEDTVVVEGFNYSPMQRVKVPGNFSHMRRGLGWMHDQANDVGDMGGGDMGGDGGGGAEGEEVIEDEEAGGGSKKAQARQMYQMLRGQGLPRKEIIAMFQQRIGLTPSSAVAYYERIAKEFGETEQQGGQDAMGMPGMGGAGGPGAGPGMGGYGMDQGGGMGQGGEELGQGQDEVENEVQEWESGNRQGVIRRVKNSHLVYKRQQDDGTFTELWVYRQGDRSADELDVRRDILAGTDIPPQKTKSPDGRQEANVWSSGNVQFLEIEGLPN